MYTIMKTMWILLFLAMTLTAYGQTLIEELPNKDGRLHFSKVIEFENMPKDKLYAEARFAFLDIETAIMQENQEVGEMTTRTRINDSFSVRFYMYNYNVDVDYYIKVSVKDNKIKLDMYEITFFTLNAQRNGKDEQKAEEIFAKENYYKKNGEAKPSSVTYKEKIVKIWEHRVQYFTESLSRRLKAKADDW